VARHRLVQRRPARPTPGIPTTSAVCSASGLALVGTGGQGAAGTLISTFGLRNTGTGTCVLSAFPGASLVDAQGQQIGAAARRQGAAGGQVRLAPGQAASFQLALAHAGCPSSAPVSHALRVYPLATAARYWSPMSSRSARPRPSPPWSPPADWCSTAATGQGRSRGLGSMTTSQRSVTSVAGSAAGLCK